MGRTARDYATHEQHQHHQHESPELAALRYLVEMQTRMAESQNGVTLRGARPVAVGASSTNDETLRPLSNGAGRLVGYTLTETAGTATLVRFFDHDENGQRIWQQPLAANGSATLWMPGGLSITNGLALVLYDATGATKGGGGAISGNVALGAAE